MHLSDEQLRVIISWAKRTPDVQAVFLHGHRPKGTALPDSDVDLALSVTGDYPLRRLTTFINHWRAWREDLEAALVLAVHLERAPSHARSKAGYVELWRRV